MRLTPVTAIIGCAGTKHRLSWQDGELAADDHPDAERERALTALGGETYRCLELLEVWSRHVDDLDVLVLASRGPGDRLAAGAGEDEVSHVHPHRHGGASYSYASFSTSSYAPLSAMSARPEPVGLLDVLRLGGGLPARLTAQVITAWSVRLERGDDAVEAARPRLHAALHGRFVVAVRDWLGEPGLQVDLRMSEPGSAPVVVRRNDTGLDVRLPFSWLADVWLPGLAVVADRLAVSSRQPHPGRVELDTLDRTLLGRATLTIEVDG